MTCHVMSCVTLCHDDPHFGEGEVIGDQRWHHSKERWWIPVGSPLWPLCYL